MISNDEFCTQSQIIIGPVVIVLQLFFYSSVYISTRSSRLLL